MQFNNKLRLIVICFFVLFIPFSAYVKWNRPLDYPNNSSTIELTKLPNFDERHLLPLNMESNKENIGMTERYKQSKLTCVLLWAPSCSKCPANLAFLEELQNKYEDKDFGVIGISVGSSLEESEDFLKTHNVTYPIFIDSENEVLKSLDTSTLPVGILIDDRAQIKEWFLGDIIAVESSIKQRLESD